MYCSAQWCVYIRHAENEEDAAQQALEISSVTPITELTYNVDANEVLEIDD